MVFKVGMLDQSLHAAGELVNETRGQDAPLDCIV